MDTRIAPAKRVFSMSPASTGVDLVDDPRHASVTVGAVPATDS